MLTIDDIPLHGEGCAFVQSGLSDQCRDRRLTTFLSDPESVMPIENLRSREIEGDDDRIGFALLPNSVETYIGIVVGTREVERVLESRAGDRLENGERYPAEPPVPIPFLGFENVVHVVVHGPEIVGVYALAASEPDRRIGDTLDDVDVFAHGHPPIYAKLFLFNLAARNGADLA